MFDQRDKAASIIFTTIPTSQASAEINLAGVTQAFAAGLAEADGVTISVVVTSHPISKPRPNYCLEVAQSLVRRLPLSSS
jgi:hypothetical protein